MTMRTKTSKILVLSCLALALGSTGGRGGRAPHRPIDGGPTTQLAPVRVAAASDCDAPQPPPLARRGRPPVETCSEATP